ncbi:bifunctional diaminohydroxyphosphoribosylaminopyrimidine deaminase/5-amino-6-(5-phosphoribosylamino)uracil reductase RibD [Rhizobium sp. Root482]|uniref:bifunctional diaminohydroxyphosphoribosylaminopyrimidine deaminase/5-amino-6-(5-phosphoribosylamino)uracil reductase RibD n=1 Tax=Rhizobium sp. Root482 TaxID=1736543 RepID=UPI0006FD9F2D|nr:bifunctional diaminohydroxyphosphoribosylaminopyrimidine deaminase/5-amino-6-(5-phosphoribosylamino)uracil reductase RibD [Rhizobium sp. Root482]KQY19594.1 bifunctional diaminohydroxyphosphoribosylaminopyrimidine deaminase/5-amino-6-(5-phosphoribosylamino)uracil reductase [Rhizobium sp. Root482]
MTDRAEDERFMAEALRLAHRNLGATGSNPSVGCVIVRNDGNGPNIVGSAVTAPGGRPHAETQALAMAGTQAKGATAYVSLEPCSHHGVTPPCADALVAAGIARVVVAVTDPDQRVAGRGLARLRDAGITVDTGVMERAGERELEGYLMRKRDNRPYVTLKLAVSADGMIGLKGQGQVPITGKESREQVHRLRAETDAILVGIGTAILDDPELTCRLPDLEDRSPLRIVIDPRLELPLGSKLVRTAETVPVIAVVDPAFEKLSSEYDEEHPPLPRRDIAASKERIGPENDVDPDVTRLPVNAEPAVPAISPFETEMSNGTEGGGAQSTLAERRAALQSAGVELVECDPTAPGDLLTALATRGVSSLMVEGGARTAQTFLNAGLVDRILLFTGAVTLGVEGVASPIDRTLIPVGFVHVRTDTFGEDLLDTYEYERTP